MSDPTTASLLLDATVEAYIDIMTEVADADPDVQAAVRKAVRQASISALEAVLDFEDQPALEQFDRRLAMLAPEPRRMVSWDEAMEFAYTFLPDED